MGSLTVEGLGKSFPTRDGTYEAVKNLDLVVRDGEFLCLVGPSGCGKTTILRCLSGLAAPTVGQLSFDGAPITEPIESMAIVFQEYGRSLYPWLTVARNIQLPLAGKGIAPDEIRRRTSEALEAVGLQGLENRHPWQLSGGMQQRVAIARALAYRPRVLLMDEPFASVDAQTREDLEDLLLALRASYEMMVVFVTHDIEESVYLGDRVVVLSAPPTSVRASFDVNLPYPRTQVETKALPEFISLRGAVYQAMRRSPAADLDPADGGRFRTSPANADSVCVEA